MKIWFVCLQAVVLDATEGSGSELLTRKQISKGRTEILLAKVVGACSYCSYGHVVVLLNLPLRLNHLIYEPLFWFWKPPDL
jgi:hypothetical protein